MDINVSEYESTWLPALISLSLCDDVVDFVLQLDQTYQGIDNYLYQEDLPGYLITNFLKKNKESHYRLLIRSLSTELNSMPFFKIGIGILLNDKTHSIWNPINETLKHFVATHPNGEVIYFENERYRETISAFLKKFSLFSESIK